MVVALTEFEEVANNFLEVNTKEEMVERMDIVGVKLKMVCSLLKINPELSLNPSSW